MAHYRCEKCGKIEEAKQPPDACPMCGAAATAAYPRGAASSDALLQESVEHLFDLEPLPTPPPAATPAARLKPKRDPTSPAFLAAKTIEDGAGQARPGGLLSVTTAEMSESELTAAREKSIEPSHPSQPVQPLSGPISSETTLELKEEDLGIKAPPSPLASIKTLETGPDGNERPAQGEGAPALSPASTLELKDDELMEESQTEEQAPMLRGMRPGGLVVIDGLGSVKEDRGRTVATGAGLIASTTLELKDDDLVEAPKSQPAAPPPPVPAAATGAVPLHTAAVSADAPVVVKPLRGRVAFPISDEEKTPTPAAAPREVDELAVAGEPPVPRRRERALTSQTETLNTIKARKRRRALLGSAFVLAAAALGIGVHLIATRSKVQPASPPDMGRPDLRPPDSRRPDVARDLPLPDLPASDVAVRRPIVRAPKPVAKRELKPDAGGPAARVQVKELYQEGLQRLMRGESSEAVRLFNEVLAKSPRHGLACRGLGLAYEKLGRPAMAKEAFNRYLAINPNAADAELIRKRIESLK